MAFDSARKLSPQVFSSPEKPVDDRSDLFEPDHTWLIHQEVMANGWNHGCQRLLDQMNAWLDELTPMYCHEAVRSDRDGQGAARYRGYLSKIWNCWSQAWQQRTRAPASTAGEESRVHVDGWQVADDLRGLGSTRADLIRDVVLAEAALQGEQKAYTALLENYRPLAVKLARTVDPVFGPTLAKDDHWWDDVIREQVWSVQRAKEVPTDAEPASLHHAATGSLRLYAGRGSLKAWLMRPLKHRLQRELARLREQESHLPAEIGRQQTLGVASDEVERSAAPTARPRASARSDEWELLLREFDAALHDCFQNSPIEDRIVLQCWSVEMLVLEGIAKRWPSRAPRIGLSEGSLLRRIQRSSDSCYQALLQRRHDADWSTLTADVFLENDSSHRSTPAFRCRLSETLVADASSEVRVASRQIPFWALILLHLWYVNRLSASEVLDAFAPRNSRSSALAPDETTLRTRLAKACEHMRRTLAARRPNDLAWELLVEWCFDPSKTPPENADHLRDVLRELLQAHDSTRETP